MSEPVTIDAQLGVSVWVSIEPDAFAVLSLLPSGGAVWLNSDQRLALARALAPEAFAVVDAVMGSIYEHDTYRDETVFEASLAYQHVATPASQGGER